MSTMTDIEMLSLAAKAAGHNVLDVSDGSTDLIITAGGAEVFRNWNPLEDDGDALRLAVDLDIDVIFRSTASEVWSQAPMQRTIMEAYGQDKYAATRRAITRAAAKIGRSMK